VGSRIRIETRIRKVVVALDKDGNKDKVTKKTRGMGSLIGCGKAKSIAKSNREKRAKGRNSSRLKSTVIGERA
jgi:hypothetical protein